MCVNPTQFIDKRGFARQVACRVCYQCRANRIQGWTGRVIAENETCLASSFLTLTYGSTMAYGEKIDDLGSKVLIYRDVQLFLKRMREDGYPLRYFVAGEYGEKKGRSHWHLLAFWLRQVPKPELDPEGIEWKPKHWPHGFIQWDGEVTPKSVPYVTKYLLKDSSSEASQNLVRMSKAPPLGAYWFEQRAERIAEQGLPLQDGFYSFDHVREYKSGLPRQFMLRGALEDFYCRAYIRAWRRLRGGMPPLSDYLAAFYDRNAVWRDREGWQPERPKYQRRPYFDPPGWDVRFNETLNVWTAYKDGRRLFWSYDEEGNRAWRGEIVTETQAKALREAYAKQSSSDAYREASGRSIDRREP